MGSVVKFPGVSTLDINNLDPKDADVISIFPMDEHFMPLYEEEMDELCWFGVSAFWHIGDDLTIRLMACFKNKPDAVMYAVSKNQSVEPDMARETLSELRAALFGQEPEDDDRLH